MLLRGGEMKKYMVLQQKRYIKMTGVTLWYVRQIVQYGKKVLCVTWR